MTKPRPRNSTVGHRQKCPLAWVMSDVVRTWLDCIVYDIPGSRRGCAESPSAAANGGLTSDVDRTNNSDVQQTTNIDDDDDDDDVDGLALDVEYLTVSRR